MAGDEDQPASNNSSADTALAAARTILASPAVTAQDEGSKRRFLESKGLPPSDVNQLLLETRTASLPSIPPRTYPALPPSRLPNLIAGILRLFSVLVGGAGVLALLYSRFILPRITQTAEARRSLRQHQLALVKQLHSTIVATKAEHAKQFQNFPKVYPEEEGTLFSASTSLDGLKQVVEKENVQPESIPFTTLIRCTLVDLKVNTEGSTTEELLKHIQTSFTEVSLDEDTLQHALETSHHFHANPSEDGASRWQYIPLEKNKTSPVTESLSKLNQALPKTSSENSATQHTLQALFEFTGYLSSYIYVPYRPRAVGSQQTLTPEEELKKDIRALKGLVLNRRTFMQRP